MPSEFRFLLIAMAASFRLDDRLVTLSGIVNELETTRGAPVELAAIVGAVLRPGMQGKRLDLMAWKLGKNGELLRIEGYAGTPLILPEGQGPVVIPYPINVPIVESAIYGFHLWDRDGTFASPETLLATYLYSVVVQ